MLLSSCRLVYNIIHQKLLVVERRNLVWPGEECEAVTGAGGVKKGGTTLLTDRG